MTRNIQQEILRKLLISKEGFRYKEMKPKGVESDLYNYHLQQLVKKGLVIKSEERYFLTDNGKIYVLETEPLDPLGKSTDKIKTAVINIVLRKNKGKFEVLFQTRTRLPFSGMKAIMGRGLKKGELPKDGAKRGLKEETGLDADFHVMGIIRIRWYDKKKNLLNDSISHLCVTEEYSGNLIEKNDFGENYWIDIDEAIDITFKEPKVVNTQAKVMGQLKYLHYSEIPFFYVEEDLVIDKL